MAVWPLGCSTKECWQPECLPPSAWEGCQGSGERSGRRRCCCYSWISAPPHVLLCLRGALRISTEICLHFSLRIPRQGIDNKVNSLYSQGRHKPLQPVGKRLPAGEKSGLSSEMPLRSFQTGIALITAIVLEDLFIFGEKKAYCAPLLGKVALIKQLYANGISASLI